VALVARTVDEKWDLCMAEILRIMHEHDKAVYQTQAEAEVLSIRRSEIKALSEILLRYGKQLDLQGVIG
jgi:hypothetical protein